MNNTAYQSDISAIRDRAREHVENGAVTDGYQANRESVVDMLNSALATELVCILRYKHHYYMASGINAQVAADEFLEHAEEEQTHADALATRIVQLGGVPDFSPKGLQDRSHSEYVAATTLSAMVKENLIAERIAIDSYKDMIRYLGDDDPTTTGVLEEILAVEEEHADDLAGLMKSDS
ncbi:MAG: bacterioferritin [Pseudomonadaceae bacterium]|nr:bacterioferritin [Pseudomonadaceae bacterium]